MLLQCWHSSYLRLKQMGWKWLQPSGTRRTLSNANRVTPLPKFIGAGELGELCSAVAAAAAAAAAARTPFEWVDGPLVTAMRQGDMILIDELNLAEDAVLERMNRWEGGGLPSARKYPCFGPHLAGSRSSLTSLSKRRSDDTACPTHWLLHLVYLGQQLDQVARNAR